MYKALMTFFRWAAREEYAVGGMDPWLEEAEGTLDKEATMSANCGQF
ncbi:MAG: hypothetical protein ACREN8_13725 [Candidatus Dormibacteraceae bacterium]